MESMTLPAGAPPVGEKSNVVPTAYACTFVIASPRPGACLAPSSTKTFGTLVVRVPFVASMDIGRGPTRS